MFTCSETDLKPASQYCHDSVSNEQENTTRLAQYLYHTVVRVKRIGIARLYDVFTQLVTQHKRRKHVLPREAITLWKTQFDIHQK